MQNWHEHETNHDEFLDEVLKTLGMAPVGLSAGEVAKDQEFLEQLHIEPTELEAPNILSPSMKLMLAVTNCAVEERNKTRRVNQVLLVVNFLLLVLAGAAIFGVWK